MKTVKKILSLIPALVLWLMISLFLWGFVFNQITDTDPAHKITLYVDARVTDETKLAVLLEENAGENIRMAKARAFSYALFDGTVLERADLLIVPASHVETYRDWFRPLPEDMREYAPLLLLEGEPWGIRVYDPKTGEGAAASFIDYRSQEEAEEFYLFFGNQSLHTLGNENALDNEAVSAAKLLMENDGKEGEK